ncbi:Serine/threonine-protein kinase PLK4, partial [Galemys pyrenaicus]
LYHLLLRRPTPTAGDRWPWSRVLIVFLNLNNSEFCLCEKCWWTPQLMSRVLWVEFNDVSQLVMYAGVCSTSYTSPNGQTT